MGYPMTWRRLINRNGLVDGGYDTAPTNWQQRVNTTSKGLATEDEFAIAIFPHARERLAAYEQAAKALAGDLRRLEQDAVDERGICWGIAERTGIDAEIVAAVLVEFLA